ncbi:YbjN domain-containing protein [Brevundimonas sp. GCM10030266]|uniref:YbjN domain-containing protein n=1 Tax=Brevundimonas sp. GCM10030266 TaxID=3273386 RepID=UPI00361F1590
MRLLLTTLLSLGLATALSTTAPATPAAAQVARIERAQVYRSILPSEMATLLNGSGYARVEKAGANVFNIETREGFLFSVEMAACDVENDTAGCFGIIFYSTWELEPSDRSKVSTMVTKFNDDYRIGKAFLLENSIYAERYVTTDGGVTQDHIREEAETFLAMMDHFGERLREAVGN